MTITREGLKERLDYDPVTGVFTWREKPDNKSWNTRYAGKRAGHVETNVKSGYKCRRLHIEGSNYLEHRLAFLYMTGRMPKCIDHDNRNGTDNRWCNLYETTTRRNSHNLSKPKNNTSGVTGVSWNKKCKKWAAYGEVGGKRTYLGWFTEIDEAAMAVLEFRSENGFHREHGIELAHYHQEVV